ncbi:MAG: hypothetical protein CVT64_09070 [Actinobacteria bacterium HGW-Actinobacteria-4]|nr:MAG: hypothetical protein CVT64_09070 [Actinobacteria bacterium HGW-Actinobacteria-4]
MTPSITFHDIGEDGPAILEQLAAHPDGIVVSYEGSDVARIVPLSPEERAWRDALLAEGTDPDEDSTSTALVASVAPQASVEPQPAPEPDPHEVPEEEPLEDPDDLPVTDPEEDPAPEPDQPYDPDPLEALTPIAVPIDQEHDAA